MLGILPPEIAKLIHVYVFEDVLKELLEKNKCVDHCNLDENMCILFVYRGIFRSFYTYNGCFYDWSAYLGKERIKRKFNFLKKHNRETIINCRCGKRESISKYNNENFIDNVRIKRKYIIKYLRTIRLLEIIMTLLSLSQIFPEILFQKRIRLYLRLSE